MPNKSFLPGWMTGWMDENMSEKMNHFTVCYLPLGLSFPSSPKEGWQYLPPKLLRVNALASVECLTGRS